MSIPPGPVIPVDPEGISTRPTGKGFDPMVFASGDDGRRRWRWFVSGLILAGVGLGVEAIAGETVATAGLMMMVVGVGLILVPIWRRRRSFEVRLEGVRLQHGGRVFGETTLVPWSSITWFGPRPARDANRVRLVYRQQHIRGKQFLPGGNVTHEEADRLLDRLRVVLSDRHPGLRLGGT
jgi:hypothetical protein